MNMSAKTVLPPTCYHATALSTPNGWHCPNCRRFFSTDPRPAIELQPGDVVKLLDPKVGRRRMKVGELGKILEINPLDPFPIKVQFESKKAATCVRPHQIEKVDTSALESQDDPEASSTVVEVQLVNSLVNSDAELVTDDDLTAIVGTATLSDDPELDWLAELANREHTKCLDAMNDALYAARDCGKYLIKARVRCQQTKPRGWGKWLQDNFEGSRSSAYNYIAIAENWHEKIEPFVQRVGQNSLRDGLRLLIEPSDNNDPEDGDRNANFTGGDSDNNAHNFTEDPNNFGNNNPSDPQQELDSDIDQLINHQSNDQFNYSDDDVNHDRGHDRHDHDDDSEVLELDGFKVGDRFHASPYVGELIAIISEQARPFRIDWQDWKIIDYTADDLRKWARIEPEPPQPPANEGDKGDKKKSRVANDYYPTPGGIVKALLDRVQITGQVLEPCAGHGAIASHFYGCVTNEPYPVNDFQPDYSCDACDDAFWNVAAAEGFDWVVTNPPYEPKLLIPIWQQAFMYANKGIALLLRLNYLEPCQDRSRWLHEYRENLTHLIIFNPRPQFRADTNGGDNITVAWMVWEKEPSTTGTKVDFVWDWKGA